VRLLCPWVSPGANTGVGCQFLLQGIFPTQGSNHVSCIAGVFFTLESPGKPFTQGTSLKRWNGLTKQLIGSNGNTNRLQWENILFHKLS